MSGRQVDWEGVGIFGLIAAVFGALGAAAAAAWVTGIVCVQGSLWLLLILCVFVPPISVAIGIGRWLGLL